MADLTFPSDVNVEWNLSEGGGERDRDFLGSHTCCSLNYSDYLGVFPIDKGALA